MRKSLGSKRNELRRAHIEKITRIYLDFEEGEHSKIFLNTEFGYAQITVHRPERNEKGEIIRDKQGKPKPDSKLKDYENIPLRENIEAFFAREVLPFAPDAWWNEAETRTGYEINFNKFFYQYQPPRPLADIARDLLALEKETENLLNQIVHG
jgi:type I restriction enzyme M protein